MNNGFTCVDPLFSATFRYALVSLLEIATSQEGITATELGRRLGLSVTYLSNVLSELKRMGLIKSQKGRHGGYTLMRPAQEIDLLQLHRGLAGSPPLLSGSSSNPALQWLNGLERRWQQELASTTLVEVMDRVGELPKPAAPSR